MANYAAYNRMSELGCLHCFLARWDVDHLELVQIDDLDVGFINRKHN